MDMPISLINTDTSRISFVTASLIYVGTLGFNPHNGYMYYINETSVLDSSVVKLTSGYPDSFFFGRGVSHISLDNIFFELFALLACYAAQIGSKLWTFWDQATLR
jgi:hypothetical protein